MSLLQELEECNVDGVFGIICREPPVVVTPSGVTGDHLTNEVSRDAEMSDGNMDRVGRLL